jgi:hypothetical protein
MKTMKLHDKIVRIKEEDVDKLSKIGYVFIPKHEWKEMNKADETEKEIVKDKKKKIRNKFSNEN